MPTNKITDENKMKLHSNKMNTMSWTRWDSQGYFFISSSNTILIVSATIVPLEAPTLHSDDWRWTALSVRCISELDKRLSQSRRDPNESHSLTSLLQGFWILFWLMMNLFDSVCYWVSLFWGLMAKFRRWQTYWVTRSPHNDKAQKSSLLISEIIKKHSFFSLSDIQLLVC